MSMILDALKRSREDIQPGGVPSVDTQHYQPETQSTLPRWVLVSGGAAMIVIAVLVTLLLVKFPAGQTTSAVTHVDSKASSAADVASVAADLKPNMEPTTQSKKQLAIPAVAPSPASVDKSVSTSLGMRRPQAKRALQDSQSTSAQNPQVDPAITALYQQKTPSVGEGDGIVKAPETGMSEQAGKAAEALVLAKDRDSAPAVKDATAQSQEPESEEVIDVAEVLRRAKKELGEAGLSPHPVPLLDNLSQQQKDKVPTVLYSAHDFNPAGESAVVLNGDRLTTGQRSKGFLVKEILADSVILSWGGTDFRLRALNSWVNL